MSILKKFENDKECMIRDNTLKWDIILIIKDRVPFCLSCQDDSCAHVGFTVCIIQLFERKEILIGVLLQSPLPLLLILFKK